MGDRASGNVNSVLLRLQLEQLSGRATVERKEMEERHTLVQNKVGPLLVFRLKDLTWPKAQTS